jgi:F-type H+-transporting ATPase subunit a
MQKHSIYKTFKSLLLALTLILSSTGFSIASGDSGDAEKFDAGDMIMHHVTDAHDIHLLTIGEGEDKHDIGIPLPIILYSTDDGLSVFMSSAFHHGHAAKNRYVYNHGHIYRLGENNPFAESEDVNLEEAMSMGYSDMSWGAFFDGEPGAFIDLSITKTVAGIFLTILLMFIIFGNIAKRYKSNPNVAPKGLQSFLEPLVLFIRDEVAKPSVGPRYERFLPFLLTIFFFIWIGNMLGLIPFIGGFNITGNIAVTLVLALFVFVITTVSANANYWKHIVATPGVPLWLLPLMVPIEVFGMFLKPMVLCLRLFANITAGHIIILAFMSLIFIFKEMYDSSVAGYSAAIISVAFSIFMNLLELLVAFLQAYVFTLLAALYFGAAVEEAHH